jgi:hypothetical protein
VEGEPRGAWTGVKVTQDAALNALTRVEPRAPFPP